PLAKLTDEGGSWVNWADRGKTITWIHGPVFRRLSLEKAFPPPKTEEEKAKEEAQAKQAKSARKGKKDGEKKDEETKLPASQAIEIVLTLPRDRPHGTTAYTG